MESLLRGIWPRIRTCTTYQDLPVVKLNVLNDQQILSTVTPPLAVVGVTSFRKVNIQILCIFYKNAATKTLNNSLCDHFEFKVLLSFLFVLKLRFQRCITWLCLKNFNFCSVLSSAELAHMVFRGAIDGILTNQCKNVTKPLLRVPYIRKNCYFG